MPSGRRARTLLAAHRRRGRLARAQHDIATRPSVHPHWLFHFRVNALGPALEAVRAGGGSMLDPIALPNGDHAAVCDDPQGAAFALVERAASALAPGSARRGPP
jgi:predicted enzyme related to lactoylglutathione lyase